MEGLRMAREIFEKDQSALMRLSGSAGFLESFLVRARQTVSNEWETMVIHMTNRSGASVRCRAGGIETNLAAGLSCTLNIKGGKGFSIAAEIPGCQTQSKPVAWVHGGYEQWEIGAFEQLRFDVIFEPRDNGGETQAYLGERGDTASAENKRGWANIPYGRHEFRFERPDYETQTAAREVKQRGMVIRVPGPWKPTPALTALEEAGRLPFVAGHGERGGTLEELKAAHDVLERAREVRGEGAKQRKELFDKKHNGLCEALARERLHSAQFREFEKARAEWQITEPAEFTVGRKWDAGGGAEGLPEWLEQRLGPDKIRELRRLASNGAAGGRSGWDAAKKAHEGWKKDAKNISEWNTKGWDRDGERRTLRKAFSETIELLHTASSNEYPANVSDLKLVCRAMKFYAAYHVGKSGDDGFPERFRGLTNKAARVISRADAQAVEKAVMDESKEENAESVMLLRFVSGVSRAAAAETEAGIDDKRDAWSGVFKRCEERLKAKGTE
jgi:hypothetical protein